MHHLVVIHPPEVALAGVADFAVMVEGLVRANNHTPIVDDGIEIGKESFGVAFAAQIRQRFLRLVGIDAAAGKIGGELFGGGKSIHTSDAPKCITQILQLRFVHEF
ncbi:MAG: hypothetical protein D6735_06790 [Acidobacteria bacterium]|nr:MAG: hypothetical protein D6735_06790 [Acidobacteriota bacterium]